ncbi:M1 family metallopeptidase [Chitinophagaceae bacterium MMS25-I14]
MNRFFTILFISWYLLTANTSFAYTRQDTLRGSNGTGRNWWKVQQYNLTVTFDTAARSISGWNNIVLRVTGMAHDSLQLDLQEPMVLDSILCNGKHLTFAHDSNVWWVNTANWKRDIAPDRTISVFYHGHPREAVHPPWDGGFIWTQDSLGKPWIAVACQGLGASVWWPCKDYQGEEPDSGMTLNYIVPEGLNVVANGRLPKAGSAISRNVRFADLTSGGTVELEHRNLFSWTIRNPINSYDATFYIGDYIHWSDTLTGEKGKLDLDFYALRYNEERARKQFAVVKSMIHCFEHWMGAYPFYEDGYKLVEAPYLGMEHQSAVAYGNGYLMGYMGRDRSKTGVGLLFDFIIVHESGHEWFGNNITATDIADNWIHEGFTTYTEGLFAECMFGREKAFDYIRGEWSNITNDRPVIGDYRVNDEGSSDKYDKGSAVVHMIRAIMNNDDQFRQLLRGLNKTFYHKTVTEKEFEQYINTFTHHDFSHLFSQYLRSNLIPEFEYYTERGQLYYRFNNVIPGFTLPLTVGTSGKKKITIEPTGEWQHTSWKGNDPDISKDFLLRVKTY